MTTTKKDKKAKDNKDQRRRDCGRSRERRDSQHRDRRRIREADRTTTRRRRSRSRSNRKPVLVAAPTAEAAPPAIAPAAAEVEVEDEDNEEDDEESEEEEPREDDEAEANVVPLPAPSVPPPAAKAAEEDAPVSGAAGPDEGQGKDLDFKSKDKTEGGRAETPRLAPSRSQRPPEPVKGPRTKPVVVISPEKDDKTGKGEDPKHSQYQCQVCQRKVGGGESGSFQHRRSPFHLACWVWNNSTDPNCSWKKCLQDGKHWSNLLSQKGTTGPDSQNEQKRQTPPPPIRADPEKDKKGGRDQGPDRDPGSGSAGSGKSSSLLLQMWETTLRELK